MGINELIENGFAERAFMENSVGGDYTEAYFFDENWNYTTKNMAMYVVIKEFDMNNKVMNEIVITKEMDNTLKRC